MSETDTQRDDSLGRLIARAGPRAEPPELVQARVRAAVREEWQGVAHRRRRRSLMIVAVAAAVAFAAVGIGVLTQWPDSQSGDPVAQVVRVTGDVRWIGRDGSQRPLSVETMRTVRAGDQVVTGTDGGASFTLGGEVSVRLGPGSRLRWLDAHRALLLSGAVYVDSPPGETSVPLAGKLSIDTEFGSVTHVGTQYMVLVATGALTVRVREGLVMVEAEASREVARATEEVTIDRAGAVRRGRVSPDGPQWSWVEALAAGFDVSNRTLLEFLEWTARETGRALEFADPRTRELARATVLQGSTSGLSVAQALDSVMATTTFMATHVATPQGGRLLISTRP